MYVYLAIKSAGHTKCQGSTLLMYFAMVLMQAVVASGKPAQRMGIHMTEG